ncbi:hypothetical protein L218DRAFT_1032873, partial [Marasmius fiardii PR-910]
SEARFPGKKVPRPRGNLKLGDGIYQEIHADGHEKLNSKALRMGEVSIDQYGMRCHTSGYILLQQAVPNARCESTVAHLYLDLIEEYGMVFEKLTVDGGTETGEMFACHKALRDKYMPELKDLSTHPAFVALPSTKNVVIEGNWRQWLQFGGTSLRMAIEAGQTEGYFVVNDENHSQLFLWIWSRAVQSKIDEFRYHWNNH